MRARACQEAPMSANSGPGDDRGAMVVLLCLTLLPLAFWLLGLWLNPEGYRALFGGKIGGDFTNIWTAAGLVMSGDISPLFDLAAYRAEQVRLFGADFPMHNWSYPPHLLLLIWPLGALPYEAALAGWTIGTLALYLAAAWRWLPAEGRPLMLFLLALAPASVLNIAVGQTGFLTGALLLQGLWWIDRRPLAAGLCFALLTVKPQLGLLIPFVLLAGGHWRVLFGTLAGALVLGAVSLLAFGPESWIAYLSETATHQRWILENGQGIFTLMMPSLFMSARLLGAEPIVGYVLQSGVALAAAVAVFVLWRDRTRRFRASAAVMLGAVLVSPYAFNYDMTVTSLAALLILSKLTDVGRREKLGQNLIFTVWLLPLLVFPLNAAGVPLAPVILAAALVWLARPAPEMTASHDRGPSENAMAQTPFSKP